jgi:hypothetical protein
MTIRYDTSARSILVWCDECPGFREITTTRESSRTAARAHESDAHPADRAVYQAAWARGARASVPGNVDSFADSVDHADAY